MTRLRAIILGLAVAGLQAVAACTIAGTEANVSPPDIILKDTPSFSKDIQPILNQYCIKCHQPRDAHGKLQLDDYDGVMGGSQNGPVIVPGRPQDSSLIQALKSEAPPTQRMPFHQEPLTPNRIATIERWILFGALND